MTYFWYEQLKITQNKYKTIVNIVCNPLIWSSPFYKYYNIHKNDKSFEPLVLYYLLSISGSTNHKANDNYNIT